MACKVKSNLISCMPYPYTVVGAVMLEVQKEQP